MNKEKGDLLMGYNHYFFITPKSLIDEINKCKTLQDLNSVYVKHGFMEAKDYEDEEALAEDLISPMRLPRKVHEFGKYYGDTKTIQSLSKPLFSPEIQEYFEDYGAVYGGKEILKSAIDFYQKTLVDEYQHLVDNTFEDDDDKESNIEYFRLGEDYDEKDLHLKRLIHEAKSHLRWWRSGVLNLDENDDSLCKSWLFEHVIFDLARLYKSFDSENDYVLFIGS